MINITNNIESKLVDDILINEYMIPEIILMENAANSILNSIDIDKYSKYIVIAGPGNNGGDGLALARLLQMHNKEVKIICPFNKTVHYEICKKLNIPFITKIEECDILIDAIFGVGINGDIAEPYKSIINDINSCDYKTISIDLITPGIKSDKVLMLSTFKESMLNIDVDNEVLNIGVNPEKYKKCSNKFIVDEEYIEKIKIKRNPFGNKGDYGRVTIIAKKGAALLAVKSSIRCGSGYTYLLSDSETIKANLISNPECINIEEVGYKNVIAIGPALGVSKENEKYILDNLKEKLILDADALNILSNNKKMIEKLNEDTIITPHLLEFARLSNETIQSLVDNPFIALESFKKHFKGVVLLKGKNNIVYDGKNFYIINIANSKMATAGMGDTLTGMIASYKAQGYSSLNAAILGCYKQASIGRKLAEEKDCITPTMLIENL